jgi:hypothetical protein
MTEVNSSTPLSFGVPAGDLTNFLSDLNGEPDTQAADHPNGLLTSFDVNNVIRKVGYAEAEQNSVQAWKDIVVDLPPGVVGNPQVAPQCPFTELLYNPKGASHDIEPDQSDCPPSSQVAQLDLGIHGGFSGFSSGIKVYNMIPERNEPAEFAFTVNQVSNGIYPTVVGQGAAAHIEVTTPGIPYSSFAHIMAVLIRFFGDPNEQIGGQTGVANAFFTNSSDCAGGPLVTELHVDSYENPGKWTAASTGTVGTPNFTDGTPDFNEAGEGISAPAWKRETYSSPGVTGCEKLHFDPSMALQPETTRADEPWRSS